MDYEEYLEYHWGQPVRVFAEDGSVIFNRIVPMAGRKPGFDITPHGKQFAFWVSDTRRYSFPLECQYELVEMSDEEIDWYLRING